MAFRTLKELDFKDKKVLVRVGMDVPVDKEGNITDGKRVVDGLPTLKYLLDNGAKQLILLNHIGRPKSKEDKALNHDKLAAMLTEKLGQKVAKLGDCVDVTLPADKVVLLENVRFHPEESSNDEAFAKKLASLGDVFVNDAFSVSHREQASVTGIPKFIPSCAGLLLEKEITVMAAALSQPKKPFVVLLGGAKVSDKLGLIKSLLPKVDALLLGGAMIFTFYKAKGFEVGSSLVEDSMVESVKPLLGEPKIALPVDIVEADKKEQDAQSKVVDAAHIDDKWYGLDIGPKTVKHYTKILSAAKSVVWNGPMGLFEVEKFAKGTNDIAAFLAGLKDVTSIIGGGDTASAIGKTGLQGKFTHISTGGGASLELLEGKTLPGIKALEENREKPAAEKS
jgi:phosphoglycerate kinase